MAHGSKDTIAAIATPAGKGGIGVVRVSGPLVAEIAVKVLGKLPKPRVATFSTFSDSDGQNIDHGLGLYFPAPHSFTGEDVLELQGHGGPIVIDLLLQRTLELGARIANPGEFSLRAFLNDKMVDGIPISPANIVVLKKTDWLARVNIILLSVSKLNTTAR